MNEADDTLGGYRTVHGRAPAFGGKDGHPYSVSTFVDEEPNAQGRYGGALLFIRWAAGADRPLGHLETDYLTFARTPQEALAPLLALSLHEVKSHLDRCIDRAVAEGKA